MIIIGSKGGAYNLFLYPSFKEKIVSIEDSLEEEILKKINISLG